MKPFFKSFSLLCLAGLLVIAAGCVSATKRTENMLTAAGFKTEAADTPQRQAHLATLPDDKIIPVKRHGVVRFVFADKAHNEIYVGTPAQYLAYQQLVQERQELQAAKDDMSVSRYNAEVADITESGADWDTWDTGATY